MACCERPERRQRRARSGVDSVAHASRRMGRSSRAKAHAMKQEMVIGLNAVVHRRGQRPRLSMG